MPLQGANTGPNPADQIRGAIDVGLFDTVELYDGVHLPEYPDAVAPADAVEWQTKAIDRPSMTTFRITADGRLIEEEWHMEEVPPDERPYAERDDVDEEDFLYMAGSLDRVHDGWIERDDYHGRFNIKHSFEELDTPITYQVTFTHGRLEGFERYR